MANPGVVLVHGANHQAICWQPMIEALADVEPDASTVAIDLPGRGGVPIDLARHDLGACARSVVAQVEGAGVDLDRLVLVGHSLGGLVATQVAILLGPGRVEHLVLVAAAIPAEGATVAQAMGGAVRLLAPVTARKRELSSLPTAVARRGFCNGMTAEQQAFVLDNLCPDAAFLVREPVTYEGLFPGIGRTWVRTTDDRMVSPAQQDRSIAVLAVDDVIDIAAGHDVMVSEPRALAQIIADRCVRSF